MLKAIKARVTMGPDSNSTLRAGSQVSGGGLDCHELKGQPWD